MKGYAGKILRVDLTSGRVRTEPVDAALARDYIGGRGFAARIIFDEVKDADPLGPDNKLVLAAGPLSGVFLPAGAKATFAAKSPATGIYGDANIGGHLAAEMKYAGYDAIVFEGAAPEPVYLYIDDAEVDLRPADYLWGQGTVTAEQSLKAQLGDEFQIAAIGPAGENRVYFACIGHDIGRQAGRTGVGAVMGSKKLKAIAIRGTGSVEVADLEAVRRIGREMILKLNGDPGLQVWHDYGLTSVATWSNSIGALPTRNYQSGYFESAEGIGHAAMKERIFLSTKACFGCPMACGKFTEVKERGIRVEGPEYETIALIGSNCGFDRIEDVAYLNQVCDELGLDTISAGNAIAFAIECYQNGVISAGDTGGLELRFGDADAFASLAGLIARREGIGDVLANGVRHAATVFGGGTARYAIQVKGLEWSGYEARGAPAMMLAYATCDIGASHNRAWAITHDIAAGRDLLEGKAEKVIELQHIRPLFDLLGACRLQWVEMGLDLKYYADIYPAVTGVDASWDDLLTCSERVFNLTRLYAQRELPGFGRSFDYPPARFMEEPVPTGETKGKLVTREQIDWLLDRFYELRGWDRDGHPKPETLRRLRLP
ncbi:MAG: aldehyde ferredoxin oxidoreductase family protein [Chloroflexi bacterium]|nr:aldehyde ferredoxin oxidoreductase family protein [Chloroflexota bacterium]